MKRYKHLCLEARLDLLDMLQRYSHYGWTKKAICHKWGISMQSFRSLKNELPSEGKPRRIQLNSITAAEKQQVIDYALAHTELNHREMSYRMIDEDVAYMSASSVYRILTERELVQRRKARERSDTWNPHARLSAPDEVWQTDLMYINFYKRDFYLLTYLDVYSRFVVYHELCLTMTGDSIRDASKRAITATANKPLNIQSDNGSCYVSSEYRSFLKKSGIDHKYIHPHCPNENAEIERYHRTLRELIDPSDADSFEILNKLIKEQIDYYNYKRYHSAIGYITPYDMYRGRAEMIYESRKRKLKQAKQHRMKTNFENFKDQKNQNNKKAA